MHMKDNSDPSASLKMAKLWMGLKTLPGKNQRLLAVKKSGSGISHPQFPFAPRRRAWLFPPFP
jgi:hypothetical protein